MGARVEDLKSGQGNHRDDRRDGRTDGPEIGSLDCLKVSVGDRHETHRSWASKEPSVETVTVDRGGLQSFLYNFAGMIGHERFTEKKVPVTEPENKPIDPMHIHSGVDDRQPRECESGGGRRPDEEEKRMAALSGAM